MDAFEIDICNRQSVLKLDTAALGRAIRATLVVERVKRAVISVSLVDNDTIHRLNREHLNHDFPTDVISFQLAFDSDEDADEDATPSQLRAACAAIEGDIVASAEMALQVAAEHGWTPQQELTLYVLHGLLHVCGYDDLTDDEASIMREREQAALEASGL